MHQAHRGSRTRSIGGWMRVVVWTALCVLAGSRLPAQDFVFESAVSMGGSRQDVGQAIAVDASGNTFVTGHFSGSADFDPGTGATVLTAIDTGTVFVARYGSSGTLAWAFALGGTGNGLANRGLSIAAASNGDVVVFGAFSGTADFNPGAGTYSLTARAGATDLFVARYSAIGAFLWAFRLPISPTLQTSYQHTMTLDRQENIIIVGSYYGTIDFDPGTKKAALSAASTAVGCSDLFVAKYSPLGAFLMAFGVGSSTDFEDAAAVAVDGSNDILITGRLGTGLSRTTVDFNPASRVTNNVTPPAGRDFYVAKYSSSGAYRWAFAIGGELTDRSLAIMADADDNVIVTGYYMDTVDFDPSANVALLAKVRDNPSEFASTFIAKYSPAGAYCWAIKLGNGYGHSLTSASDGDIVVAGTTAWSWDLDPGPDTNIVGSGPYNGFVGRYTSSGVYVDAFGLHGAASHAYGIARDGSGDLYITGDFGGHAEIHGATDFDPGAGEYMLTASAPAAPDTSTLGDIFIARYGEELLLKPNVDGRRRSSRDSAVRIELE